MLLRNTLIFLALSSVSGVAAANDDDMLKPDQIQTTGVEANPANDSGMFLGAGLTFGQARSTEEDVSPGTALIFGFEPGYQVRRGSFGRLEFSGQLLSGFASFRPDGADAATKAQLPFGVIFKAGMGWSLGGKLYGVAKAGVGPVMGKIVVHPDGGDTYKSDTASGLAAYAGWIMAAPLTDSLDATGGISWTHYQLNVDSVKSGGAEFKVDSVLVNVPAVELGVRVRL